MTLVFSAVVVLIGLEIKSFLSEAKTSLLKHAVDSKTRPRPLEEWS